MVEIRYAVEGETDAVLAARLIEACGGRAVLGLIAKGKPKLDPKVGGILRASNRHQPWLVLRDLDNDAECAATLLARLAPIESEFSAVRVAVRQAESWLLADRDAFASAFAVPVSKVAAEPDACEDAKRALVDACQNSRRRQLRDDMVPRPGAGRKVGPGYEANLTDFIASTWDPWRASARSDSLRRALSRVTDLIERCQAPGTL